jgi:hypothetical protein
MAGRGGARPGAGRPQGPSRATIERALIAERTVQSAKATGNKLAKERLEELMEIFIGATAYFQPTVAIGTQPNPNQDWGEFEKWGRLAMECAAKLAPYQSPTFRAVMVSAPPPAQPEGNLNNVFPIGDPVAAARTYRRIVSAGGER